MSSRSACRVSASAIAARSPGSRSSVTADTASDATRKMAPHDGACDSAASRTVRNTSFDRSCTLTGRHTAITTLVEKGLPDWVIQAQVGHVAPEMMKTYSHIRRQALNQAADALEPTAPTIASATTPRERRPARVMSHCTSQSGRQPGRVLRFVREVGSSGWIRTSNPPVNSRMLCR